MANASCATVTVVNTAMVVSGSVSGTILVGATITEAGVPPGVTVVSQQSGTTGQAGNYTVTASAANVTTPAPAVFSLSGIMPWVSNAVMPQIVDIALAAGLASIFFTSIPSPTAAMGQEYRHGTHAEAIYNQQAGLQKYPTANAVEGRSVIPTVLTLPQYPEPIPSQTFKPPNLSQVAKQVVRQISVAPQQFDLTQNGWFVSPTTPQSTGFFAFEYQYGTHSKAIYDAQAGGTIFPAVAKPPAIAGGSPLKTIVVNPQELGYDLTLQGWSNVVPVSTGWLLTMVTAGPQGADLTVQAQLSPARPFQSAATPKPLNPVTIIAAGQVDTTQLAAFFDAPPLHPAVNRSPTWFSAAQETPPQLSARIFLPTPLEMNNVGPSWFFASQQDPTQLQPQIYSLPFKHLLPGIFQFAFEFGVNDKVLFDAQAGGTVFPAVATPITAPNLAPLKTIIVNPQELGRDLTIQGWSKIPSVPNGWLLTMITAGPQAADLTVPAQITPARPFTSLAPPAPLNPRTIVSVSQADTTQLQAFLDAPPLHQPPNTGPAWFFARQEDPTQIQPLIFQRKIAGGQRYPQPVYAKVDEQGYSNSPSVTFKPLVLFVPPPPTPYVQPVVVQVSEQFYINPPFLSTSSLIIKSKPPIPPVPPGAGGQYGDRVILQAKKLGETVFVPIDFISKLGAGETLVSAVCTCTVYTGNDPSPQSMIVGVAAISGTIVNQLTTGGVLGTIYEFLAKALTSAGQTIELSGFLAVVPDLP